MRASLSDQSNAGVVMIDALVGVAIISVMVAAVLLSLNLSRRITAQASDLASARRTLSALAATMPRHAGTYTGDLDGYRYRVTVVEIRNRQIVLCGFRAQIAARNHRHSLAGIRACDNATS